jgi:hypothetical protein
MGMISERELEEWIWWTVLDDEEDDDEGVD